MANEWAVIRAEYDAMERMSCVPKDIRKVREDHIFDEEQTVRWNREQVAKNNRRYQDEVARLNTLKHKRRDSIHDNIYTIIQREVGYGLTRKKAIALWNYAYQKGHACGIADILNYLDDLMELARTLLEKEDK